MKKLLLAAVCSVSAMLFADTDLRLNNFSAANGGNSTELIYRELHIYIMNYLIFDFIFLI